ncbi:Peptidase C48 [Macleaya cordata]|uniref:Peptidase C48 n=1 Tax=Macleaya cordata TaxID=56857 RepID=A0A200R624_MACCD|nr:Peptidase C48 [Macleaya cordata]
MADEKILSYNDVVLRRSDLGILSGPHFLNDRIIEFYFSYLASCCPSEDILLVPPSISFWITNCPDRESLKDFVEPLKLAEKKVVIFAVNDNEDVTQAEGGTHWSLLAYERNAKVFVHHDSMGGSNWRYAKRLYNAVVRFKGVSDSAPSEISLAEYPNTPQQMNGYDCGLYVTAIAKVICDWHRNGGSADDEELWFSALKKVAPSVASDLRKEILKLIRDLMAKR